MAKRVVRTATAAAVGRAALQVKVEEALFAAQYTVEKVRGGEPWTFMAVRRGDSFKLAVRVTTARRLNLESHIEVLTRSAPDEIDRILIVLDRIPAGLKNRDADDKVRLVGSRALKGFLSSLSTETARAVKPDEPPIDPQVALRERVATMMRGAGYLIHRRLKFEFELRVTKEELERQREIVIYCGGGPSGAARDAFEARDKSKPYWFVDYHISPVVRKLVADVPFVRVLEIGHLEAAVRRYETQETLGGDAATITDAPPGGLLSSPPTIPEPRPAAISPEWIDGRLAIVAGAAQVDLSEHELMAAFAAAGAELGGVLADLEASPGNVDRRVIAFARRVADALPTSPPSQFALFVFGQKVDALKRRIDLAVRDGELTADRAAEVQTAVDQLADLALQFPAWRQFKRNARSATLTNEQVAGARELAGELANRLETTEAKEFVDESVPAALRDLAASGFLPDDSPGAAKEGADLPALDLIESAENIHKSVASAAVAASPGAYLRDVREGALKTLTDGKKHGERLVIWALSLLAGAAGAAPSWAPAVINFLRQISGG